MVHTPTITDITSLVYNTDTRIEEHVHKYRNTQSQIRSIYSVLLPPPRPKKPKNKTIDPEDAQPRPVPL